MLRGDKGRSLEILEKVTLCLKSRGMKELSPFLQEL